MDNFYNSPLFGITSNQQGTSVAGTMKGGEYTAANSEGIVPLKWDDMNDVPGITCYHDMEPVLDKTLVVDTVKPQPVCDYNTSTGGNDLKDKILQPRLLEKKKKNSQCKNPYMVHSKKSKNSTV
jgi:hypothetical protein